MPAWSTSNVFAQSVQQAGANTVNYGTDTYKVAVYGSGASPDKTATGASIAYGTGTWAVANEVSSSGYTAGGSIITQSWAQSSASALFTSSTQPSWNGVTFTAYGDLIYSSTHSNYGLCFNYFGGAQQVTAGTFTLSFSNGIATFAC